MKYPMSYEEYETTVKELFMEKCLPEVSVTEREAHFNDNLDVVRDGYIGECYYYDNNPDDRDKCFTLYALSGSVLWNLENLY